MNDREILDLFLKRDERAITLCQTQYGTQCEEIALRILADRQDAEKCVNDTWLKAWNAIPPAEPASLRGYLLTVTRNLAINRLREKTAAWRGGGEMPVALEELSECVAGGEDVAREYLTRELGEAVDRFLRSLSRRDCDLFLGRYYFLCTTFELGNRYGISEAHVRAALSRVRRKLRRYLEKQGYL